MAPSGLLSRTSLLLCFSFVIDMDIGIVTFKRVQFLSYQHDIYTDNSISGSCGFNGDYCTLVETSLVNPTTPGSGSSSDISLVGE